MLFIVFFNSNVKNELGKNNLKIFLNLNKNIGSILFAIFLLILWEFYYLKYSHNSIYHF